MGSFAATAAGRILAEEWAKAKIADHTWTNAHMAVNKAGATIVRFQRPASPSSATTKEYGGWTESTEDDAT
jgi:hypothetical protein